MMNKIVEKDGQKYLIMGDKAIPFSRVDGNGKPIIDVKSEEITHPDGRKDVKILVPCLKVVSENKELK